MLHSTLPGCFSILGVVVVAVVVVVATKGCVLILKKEQRSLGALLHHGIAVKRWCGLHQETRVAWWSVGVSVCCDSLLH